MIRHIINGYLYDGLGSEPYLGCLEISPDGKIRRITRGVSRLFGPDVIDAEGMTVTPGFVDIHRHHDLDALFNPQFGDIELAQGITTAIAGNCGLSAFPNDKDHPEKAKAQFSYMEPVLGKVPEDCALHTFEEYISELKSRPLALNVGTLVGAGAIATTLIGYESRGFTDAERSRAAAMVEEAMEHGAAGLSFGIMYLPESYLSFEDHVAMASACARHGGVVCTHIRGEGDSLAASVKEVIDICREAGAPLNISHFKATGVRNWGKGIGEAIDLIEQARAAGQRITVDVYPYTGGATTAMSLIPPSVIEGHPVSYLGTAEGAKKLKEEIYRRQPGWDNMVESIGWDRVIIGSVNLDEDRPFSGKSVKAIQDELGLDDPCEWFGSLVAREQGQVGITIMSMSQDDVDRVMRLPYAAVISDSLYGGGDSPHPRLYGSFPRVIREYVRERHVLSMSEAVRKMTSAPADRVGLRNRGRIQVGCYADLNIFKESEIRDVATYDDPKQLAKGIRYTLIEGSVAASDSVRLPRVGFGHFVSRG